jgi:hypothetical protein
MSLFASSSGLQINGGSFYNVAGDLNIQNTLPDTGPLPPLPLEFGSSLRLANADNSYDAGDADIQSVQPQDPGFEPRPPLENGSHNGHLVLGPDRGHARVARMWPYGALAA